MILVFTGNGKGKTTAAIGQAIRVLGGGGKVLMIQFIKGPWVSGEHLFMEKFSIPSSRFSIKRTGKGFVGILGDKFPLSEHKKSARKGLEFAANAVKSKKYDLIILDEINNAVGLKLVKEADVLKIIRSAPAKTDMILTGRNAPESFIRIADIVTEMKEVKHIFQKNKRSTKKGIEY